jgi:hypothetical protein
MGKLFEYACHKKKSEFHLQWSGDTNENLTSPPFKQLRFNRLTVRFHSVGRDVTLHNCIRELSGSFLQT